MKTFNHWIRNVTNVKAKLVKSEKFQEFDKKKFREIEPSIPKN